jgi:hypothetical protein
MRSLLPLTFVLFLAALGGCQPEGAAIRTGALTATPMVSGALNFGSTTVGGPRAWQTEGTVAFGGGVFLTAWTPGFNITTPVTYLIRNRATDGMFLDETPIVIEGNADAPVLGSDGKDFLISWIGYKVIHIARVSGDGKVLDTPAIEFHQPGGLWLYHQAIAYGGGNYLLVWDENTPGQANGHLNDILAARVDPATAKMVGPIIHVTTLPSDDVRPAVAFDGTNFLVVWEDHRDAMPAIYGNRMRPSDGALLDGANGFRVGSSASGQAPAVAFGGGEYLVAFQAGTSLAGARIRPADHSTPDPTELTLATSASTAALDPPKLAWDGAHFVLTWRTQDTPQQYLATRVDPDTGKVLDPSGLALGTSKYDVRGANGYDVAAGGGRILAVFSPMRDGGTTPTDLIYDTKGAWIDPASGALARPVFGFPQTADWQQYPDCSSDGQHHLVVWQERTGGHFEIRGARVSNADGTLYEPDSFTISSGAIEQVYPRTASNGSNHLVVWCDGASLRAGRVKGSDGSLLDGAGIALPGKSGAPSSGRPFYGVASDGSDYLVLWTEEAADPVRLRAARVRGSDGVLLDTTAISVAADGSRRLFPRVAFSGSRYLAAWLDDASDELLAVRIATNGTVLDSTPIGLGKHADATALDLAGDGENVLVAVTEPAGIRARRVRMADGAVLPDAELLLTADHDGAALAFDGERYLLASRRTAVGTSYQYRITRVSRAGTLLDGAPIDVVTRTDSPGYELGLSSGTGGRALLVYDIFDTIGAATSRARAHLLTDPPPPPSPDAAVPDAALPPEAGTPDSSAPDVAASVFDGPLDDGGAPVPDGGASTPDGGATADAGAVDGGITPTADASSADGAIPLPVYDAAAERPGKGKSSGGCQLGGRPPSGGWALVTLALMLWRRRRR